MHVVQPWVVWAHTLAHEYAEVRDAGLKLAILSPFLEPHGKYASTATTTTNS